MAVSNQTSFAETAQELVIDARRELGIHAEEEPLEAVDLQNGLNAINRMLKAWQADGVMPWTFTDGTLSLVQAQGGYVFGPGGDYTTVPFEITEIRINRNGNDLPMYRLSRDEYLALPNKTTEGYPTQFYYDRQRSGGTLYLWPTPDTGLGTLKFSYSRIIMDMANGTNDIDLPQEWHEAIVFGLADRLVGQLNMSGKPAAARVKAEAERSYQVVRGFAIGEGQASVRVLPTTHYRGPVNA